MINLLPPRYKQELKQEENFKIILILGVFFLFSLVSLVLILFSIKIYIQSQLEYLKIMVELEEKIFQKTEIQYLQKEITFANQNLSELKTFYQHQINLTNILEKISQILPPGMYLTTFFWEKSSFQIFLTGFSPSREILFEFKKNLEQERYFTEINFPPANWLKPSDIDFQVNFKVTGEL